MITRLTLELEQANELCWELRAALNRADLLPYDDADIVDSIEKREELVQEAKCYEESDNAD